MHQQVKTSPDGTDANVRRVLEVLADAGINVEGVGPDFESPHVRVHIDHEEGDDGPTHEAIEALEAAGLHPVPRQCITVSLPNAAGALRTAIRRLERDGWQIESVLVLASHDGDKVRVSVGVTRKVEDEWEASSIALASSIVEDES